LVSIPNLANTIIEGYLYPYKDSMIFYPVDIPYSQNNDVSDLPFLNNTKSNRFNMLMYSINAIKMNSQDTDLELIISNRFDQHIVHGSQNYLLSDEFTEYGEVSGLLFIPISERYLSGKTNEKMLIWNDTSFSSNREISLNLNVSAIDKSLYTININGKEIPEILLPRIKNKFIKIPQSFIKKEILLGNDVVLFKINMDSFNRIDTKYPLIPLSKLDNNIQEYSEVLNILTSIVNPLPNKVFTELFDDSLNINGNKYSFVGINKPLVKS